MFYVTALDPITQRWWTTRHRVLSGKHGALAALLLHWRANRLAHLTEVK